MSLQLEPNLLRDCSQVREYRNFSRFAFPNKVIMTSAAIVVPSSPLTRTQMNIGSSTIGNKIKGVYEIASSFRTMLFDSRRLGVEGIIKDFHLKAICNAINNGEKLETLISTSLSREEIHEKIFSVLRKRIKKIGKYIGVVSTVTPLVDGIFFFTPPGLETGIAAFLIGHQIEMFCVLRKALSKESSWGPEKISVYADSRIRRFEGVIKQDGVNAAITFLDNCDGIKGNNLFLPEFVPLVEILAARASKELKIKNSLTS